MRSHFVRKSCWKSFAKSEGTVPRFFDGARGKSVDDEKVIRIAERSSPDELDALLIHEIAHAARKSVLTLHFSKVGILLAKAPGIPSVAHTVTHSSSAVLSIVISEENYSL